MKIHVEFNSVSEMVNFGKFVGNDLVQTQKTEDSKYKAMYETTLANLERAYERLRMADPEGKTANKAVGKALNIASKVNKLDIGARALNALNAVGITTIGELLKLDVNYLRHAIPNCGPTTARKIYRAMKEAGFEMKGTPVNA